MAMSELNNNVYATTLNAERGMEIWRRYWAVEDWYPVARAGIASPGNLYSAAIIEYRNALYVGTVNPGGAQLYRSVGSEDLLLMTVAAQSRFSRGAQFNIGLQVFNAGPSFDGAAVAVLDLGSGFSPQFYFYPTWSSSFTSQPLTLGSNQTQQMTLFNLTLPRVPPLGPMTIYSAILDSSLTAPVSPIESFTFYFQ